MSSIRDPFIEIGAGKAVFREGEAGAEMYIIESGQVELQSKARSAGPALVLGPGDFFGADFLLDNKARGTTATVRENARLLALTRASLAEAIAQNPEIALGLLRRLLEQQREGELREPAPSVRAQPAQAAAAPPAVKIQPPPAAAPAVKVQPPPAPAPPPAAPTPPPAPPPAVFTPPPAPAPAPAAVAPPRNFALRHLVSAQLLPLDPAQSEFLVGRPDPATGIRPEVDLGPFDQNRTLSRRHAKIFKRDGAYFVREDSGTTNGTYVNEERLQTGVEVMLKPGDKLRFGTIEVEFIAV